MTRLLRTLKPGAEFADGMGRQRFRLVDVVPHPLKPKRRLWKCECLKGVDGPVGPVRGAFFCPTGIIIYLQGNQEVTPL
jgi:hypothetical protein